MTDRQKEILDRIEKMRGPARAKADGLRLLCASGFPWINAFFLERAESDIRDIEELLKLAREEFSGHDENKGAHTFAVYSLPGHDQVTTIHADNLQEAAQALLSCVDTSDDQYIRIRASDIGRLAIIAPLCCEDRAGSYMIKRLD